MTIPFEKLGPILQLSVSPVILISGMGLILLTVTNRFGRMVDRARLLNRELPAQGDTAQAHETRLQIKILMRRAGILRLSIILGATTALLAGLLMLMLFVGTWLHLELGGPVMLVFCAALLSLIGCVAAFIADTNLALTAVRHEVRI